MSSFQFHAGDRLLRTLARWAGLAAAAAALAACAAAPKEPTQAQRIVLSDPAVTVTAKGETTAVATANADAADDPAIWRNAADPAQSLIVGTDKQAGIYVYGLDGKVRDFLDAGHVNNIDLRDGVTIGSGGGILVAASDRNDLAAAKMALFRLDPTASKLIALGKVAAGAGEAYGVCLYRDAGGLYAFSVLKDGTIHQILLDLSGPAPTGRIVRTMKLGTQSEGCAVDERTGRLYVAEEDVGLWRFEAGATGSTTPVKVGAADGKTLVADAEGVAVAPEGPGNGGYVIVSSQGDNAYAVFRLSDDKYMGRFRIAAGRLGATEETDGIEMISGGFGADYPSGLFIAQDGVNPPAAQNFKLVSWADIKAALKLN
jgi:3-phytase